MRPIPGEPKSFIKIMLHTITQPQAQYKIYKIKTIRAIQIILYRQTHTHSSYLQHRFGPQACSNNIGYRLKIETELVTSVLQTSQFTNHHMWKSLNSKCTGHHDLSLHLVIRKKCMQWWNLKRMSLSQANDIVTYQSILTVHFWLRCVSGNALTTITFKS